MALDYPGYDKSQSSKLKITEGHATVTFQYTRNYSPTDKREMQIFIEEINPITREGESKVVFIK